eukprot:c28787_g1_i1 orf=1595-1810(+)
MLCGMGNSKVHGLFRQIIVNYRQKPLSKELILDKFSSVSTNGLIHIQCKIFRVPSSFSFSSIPYEELTLSF